ncbi:ribosome-associated translation inhibitor RaiA [Paenibacillus filicis]|uniref:Ribosome hibernation promoting factor n=1 Tax=Paenibacillus gyeongsangnamensis TaxID=3388067 RepID=A0ABT4QDC3_9BACL|nr:ribosome-associated translation inhibitor RaiA [Paenibacillus filicis]MCZ8514792.1 ribosome-associated translation inhibitor RaiA [Paenibacillus filicis]
MNFIFHNKQMEVTDALKEYAEQKIRRVETIAPVEEAVVTFIVNGHKHDTHKVEVILHLEGGLIRAEERTGDMYASVDEVAEKLERKLRKLKEKLRRRVRRGGLPELALDRLPEEETEPYEIVRVKRVGLKPVDLEEAILEMNLLDHNFHVFINSVTRSTNVVYRRIDGTYGLITS